MHPRVWIRTAAIVTAAAVSFAPSAPAQNPLRPIIRVIDKSHKPPPPKPPAPAPGAPGTPGAATGAAPAQAAQQAQTLNAKVDEALMGPLSQRISLSEDGEHIGIITAKGSRQVVLLDGVEGPLFDEIPLNSIFGSHEVTWSPTGGHSGYIGRRGGDFIAVVDGKEAVTLATPETMKNLGYSDTRSWNFWFSRDGSRLAYAAQAAPGTWVMVVDGVKSPPYRALDFTQAVLNGKHLYYAAQTADEKWHVVVDGRSGPGYGKITSLLVTPDGDHYAFLVNQLGVGARQALVVSDGVEGPLYFGASELEQAPDGRVAYLATTALGDPSGHGGAGALMVGGMEVPAAVTFANSLRAGVRTPQHHVAWSPDGKRFAYVQQNTPNPGVTVQVNGKPLGLIYQAAGELLWSPDGTRLAYLGTSPTGSFMVIDGEELPGVGTLMEFHYGPRGNRYAYITYGSAGFGLIVDGKEQPKARDIAKDQMSWSPDGKHLVYSASFDGINYQAVVDGVTKPGAVSSFASRRSGYQATQIPPFQWSPDGNRLADVARDAGGKTAVYVDGTGYLGPAPGYAAPAWSPDSRHFAVIVGNLNTRQWQAMLDGRLSPAYEDILELSSASSGFPDARTYRFYAVKAGQVYRVRLGLAP